MHPRCASPDPGTTQGTETAFGRSFGLWMKALTGWTLVSSSPYDGSESQKAAAWTRGIQPCQQMCCPTISSLCYCAYSTMSRTLAISFQFRALENLSICRKKPHQNRSARPKSKQQTPLSSELPQRCRDFAVGPRQGWSVSSSAATAFQGSNPISLRLDLSHVGIARWGQLFVCAVNPTHL